MRTCSETFAFKCYTNFTQVQENFDKSLFRSMSNKIVAQFINEKSLTLVVNAILEINFIISLSLTTMLFQILWTACDYRHSHKLRRFGS